MGTLALLLLVLLAIAVFRTVSLEMSNRQRDFLNGVMPAPPPDGFYKGSVSLYAGSWIGKEFDAAKSAGINVFEKGGMQFKQYSFRTYPAKGLRDGSKDVLRIDYSSSEIPFFVRRVVDEIVEIAPGRLLGKAHVRIVPGFPFTVAFFELHR